MPAATILALILSCLGAGRALLEPAGTLRPRSDGVAGLSGLAALTALAGWMVLAGAYSVAASWGLLALGGGALILKLAGDPRRSRTAQPESRRLPVGAILIGLVSLVVATGRVIGELIVPFVEPWDDWPSYWHFPRLLLESGGFVEPFSFRRLSALGAAPFVQSFFWPGFRLAANGVADAVLGQLLLWAVVRRVPEALARKPQPAWIGEALALAALLVSLTIPSPNSQPTLLPMAGALGLILLTQQLATDEPEHRWRTALAWGLVAAWLIGLRTSNVIFPAGLWLCSALLALGHRDGRQGSHLALAGLATVVGLLPWCLALWQSSGTPLYPLVAGNYRFPESLYSLPLDAASLGALVLDRLWVSRVWIIAALGALAALNPRLRNLALAVVTALVLLVALSAAATSGLDAITIHRLTAPFLAAGVIVLAAAVLSTEAKAAPAGVESAPDRDWKPLLLWAVLALWFFLPVTLPDGAWQVPASNRSMFEYQGLRRATAAATAWDLKAMPKEPQRGLYEEAQARLPAAARLLSAAERPYLFRFDRQVVHTLEFLGAVSPAPGMPFFKGPEPLARYLRELGYTHLAFTPTPYAPVGQETVEFANPITGIERLLPYMADFGASTQRLEQMYPIVFRAPELVVLDLRRPSP